jgi:hypothetical protein
VTMGQPNPAQLRLARAHLALVDDPGSAPSQRSVPRVLSALAAAVVLSLAAPLAWASASPGAEPKQPAATTAAAKGQQPSPDADDDDG